MPLDAAQAGRARIALQRFGLGPKPGSAERIGADPLKALKDELDTPKTALIEDRSLPGYAEACEVSQTGYTPAETNRQFELRARVAKHAAAEIGFVERLVLFWSNHFSMTANKDDVIRGTIGQLERDVIRRHVLGKFSDMLTGVMQHPAMIRYLDNEESIGPRSKIGRAWNAGINENLARELMELHTLGAGGGYTEADVTSMAYVLSGWSFVRGWEIGQDWADVPDDKPGQFYFRPDWHEPKPIAVLGKTYAPEGLAQGEKVLLDLARHPATAQHIAFKLVRHFITDEPSAAMVDPVAKAFRKSGGDLKATALALIALPAAWNAPFGKIRTPYELGVAHLRVFGTLYGVDDRWRFLDPLYAMHNAPWERPAPDGYPDETYAWLDPDGMTIRLGASTFAVDCFGDRDTTPALKTARALYGAALSPQTQAAIRAMSDRRSGLALLFMSPEFQRR